ncbi:hypothetical protein TcCL_ESM10514 [Trypanosoma cruzi]|nr:hypothetical protein TcCL_ESM10514 [Trypanosoma cruzi]
MVDAWPGRSLLATVERLICLIAAPSTRCTVLMLLSSADKGGLHDGVSLLEGSVRRKNIVFFSSWRRRIRSLIQVRMPCCSSCWPLVALVFIPINGSHWRFYDRISTGVVVFLVHVAWPNNKLFVQLDNKFPVGVDHVLQNMTTTATDRAGGCCVLYDSDNVLADFTLLRANDVTSVPLRVAEA